MLFDTEFARQHFGGATLRAVADHHQADGGRLQDLFQNADAVQYALYGPEIRKMDQLFFFRLVLRVRMIEIAVDEVVDHADLVRDSEDVRGPLLQILTDGGDAVRFFDGKFRDRK